MKLDKTQRQFYDSLSESQASKLYVGLGGFRAYAVEVRGFRA